MPDNNQTNRLQRAALALRSDPNFELIMDAAKEQTLQALVGGKFDAASDNLRNYRAVAAIGTLVHNLAEGNM